MNKSKENLRQELTQRLAQRLNLQSVALGRILEMTTPEFEDEIRRELDDNPALEAVDDTPTDSDYSAIDDGQDDHDSAHDFRPTSRSASATDPTSWAADDGDSMIEVILRRLASEAELTPDEMRIAAHIVGNLDSNGYLTRSPEAIADDLAVTEGMDVTKADVMRVLDAVRALEPAGLGAFDLRDCLLLQLDRKEPSVEVKTAREIIANHFDLFSKMHYERLQGALEIPREALVDALELIKSLNPKPGSALDIARPSDRARHVVPDFILECDEDDDRFSVTLAGRIPDLSIEESFVADPAEQNVMSEALRQRRQQTQTFIRKKRDDALSFINLVELRSLTLLSVARAIVNRQRRFFLTGDNADIKPMILKDIAADTGLDMSVISRATAGKYISAPNGIYPLKLFFNESTGGEADISSHEILDALSKMIAAEDKHSPLSDRELTEGLARQGYDIARRTVAKYRERLGQPVARLRKQL